MPAPALEVTATIAAEPATVFRFFTDPARFARWMGGAATGQPAPGTTIDARPGGAVTVAYPGGAQAVGKVVEVDPPHRIVFTWGYKDAANGMPPGSSTVTVTLAATAEGTRVVLRHEGLPTDQARQGHEGGWRFYLSVLAGHGSREQHAGVDTVLADWYAAWGETEPGRRRALLERCFEADGSFRDGWGCVDGVAALDAHIGNSQKHLPGLRIEPAGPAQECHGHVRSAWRVRDDRGLLPMSGVNFGRLSGRGKLALVVGFADPAPLATEQG